MDEDLCKLDLYDLLEVDPTASEKEIRTAYRKKALRCHPDKNPGNVAAATQFQKLSKALEILSDVSAKKTYDQLLRARKAAEIRAKQMDKKRRLLREELEARERDAMDASVAEDTALKMKEKQMKDEVERLRREGSRMLQEEIQAMKANFEQIFRVATESKESKESEQSRCLRVKWHALSNDSNNGGYTYDVLYAILSKVGPIDNLIISKKKRGSALVNYSNELSAVQAQSECKGHPENPLHLTPVGSAPTPVVSSRNGESGSNNASGTASQPNIGISSFTSFEDMVLQKMKAAAEQQKRTNEGTKK